jgi:hypothetical protein
MQIHTAESLVPEPGFSDFETGTVKLNTYISQGSDQISAGLIQAGGETLCFEIINSFIIYGISKNFLNSGSIIVAIYRKRDETNSSNYRRTSLSSTSY